MFTDDARAVIGDHEQSGGFAACARPGDELAERPVDPAIRVEHQRMAGIEQVGEAVGPREDHEQESPWLRRRRQPSIGHGAIERGVGPKVVGRDPQKRTPRWHEVGAPTQPADDRRADRETLWHELEDRRTTVDVAVDPARLSATVAPRGTPLGAQPASGGASVEPADARHVGGPRVPAEEKRDVRDAGGGGKD